MNEIGRLLIKAAAFCLIGAGAALATFVMPLVEYAQEERVLRYQVEESIGREPSAELCSAERAGDLLAECKTSLYMQAVISGAKSELNRWIQILVVLGLVLALAGSATLARAAQNEKRERLSASP